MCGAEFLFDVMPVGLFRYGAHPRAPGHYPYEPYRGPGHYEIATRLKRGLAARCYYDHGNERISFTVRALVGYGMLETDAFEIRNRP